MAYTTTFTAPPVAGTSEVTWEGWVRTDALLPCDVIVASGNVIDATVRDGDRVLVIVNGRGFGDPAGFYPDEVFYIERKVTLTVSFGHGA